MSVKVTKPNMVPVHMLCMVSYYCPVVNLSIRCTVIEIFEFKNAVTLKNWLGIVKIIENVTV